MKKIILTLFFVFAVAFTSQAEAVTSTSVLYSPDNRTVSISGFMTDYKVAQGTYSTVLVLPEGVLPKDADIENTVYIDQMNIEQGTGYFSYSFVMPAYRDMGKYVVYFGGNNIKTPLSEAYVVDDSGFVTIGSFEVTKTDETQITATAYMYNHTYAPKKATIIISQYDGNGKLLSVTFNESTIPPLTDAAVPKLVKANIVNGAQTKTALIWDSLETVVPLIEKQIIK